MDPENGSKWSVGAATHGVRFVRGARMGAGEKKLLDRLVKDYGHGLVNG